MEDVISVKNMRESDAFTINTCATGRELMHRAAMGVYNNVNWRGNVAIICGSGNNGGDGYALGEILADRGIVPVLLRTSEKFSQDGLYYYKRCLEKGVGELVCNGDTDFSPYDIIVDCILGTGFSGELRADTVDLINAVNSADAYRVSVDINSGLNGSNGIASPVAVQSHLTVSIGYYKTGMFLNDANEYIGSLVNAPIGIKLLKKQYYLLTPGELEPFTGYGSMCVTSRQFAREYALNEEEFRLKPIKTVMKESADSKKIFVVDYCGSKMIVDQSYVYFQSSKVKNPETEYKAF